MTRRLHEPVPGQLSLLELVELVELVDQVVAARVDVAQGGVDETSCGGRVSGLGEWEQRVLAFAVEHHLSAGGLGRVRQHLGCSLVRYLQALSDLLDHPEVPAAHPELVGRLRALRDRRRRLRQVSRLVTGEAGGGLDAAW